MCHTTSIAAVIVGTIFLGAGACVAADSPADAKAKETKAAATKKPTDKSAQGGIILQNQGAAAATKTTTESKTKAPAANKAATGATQ